LLSVVPSTSLDPVEAADMKDSGGIPDRQSRDSACQNTNDQREVSRFSKKTFDHAGYREKQTTTEEGKRYGGKEDVGLEKRRESVLIADKQSQVDERIDS